jgi:hypothetical protein
MRASSALSPSKANEQVDCFGLERHRLLGPLLYSPPDNLPDVGVFQRLQHVHLQARQQRPGELEARVLRRRAHEGDHSLLHPREKGVLLCLVEPVNLVAKQDGAPSLVLQAPLRLLDDLTHPRHTRSDGAEGLEMPVGVARDQSRQRGLPRPRRAPQHHRAHLAPTHGLVERPPFTQEVFLPEELLEALGSEAGCQRLVPPSLFGEERRFHHGEKCKVLPGISRVGPRRACWPPVVLCVAISVMAAGFGRRVHIPSACSDSRAAKNAATPPAATLPPDDVAKSGDGRMNQRRHGMSRALRGAKQQAVHEEKGGGRPTDVYANPAAITSAGL